MNSEELKEKFKRIYRISSRINLVKTNNVYESIKNNQEETKNPSKVTEISKETSLSKNSVRNYLKHLVNGNYIKKTKKYTPPFLKVTDKKGDAIDFVYTKMKRDDRVEDEVSKTLSLLNSHNLNLSKELKEDFDLVRTSKYYNSKFLISYNHLIVFIWNNFDTEDFVKLEIGSGANRYVIY